MRRPGQTRGKISLPLALLLAIATPTGSCATAGEDEHDDHIEHHGAQTEEPGHDHDEGHHDHEAQEVTGADFRAGAGLRLADEAAAQIGLTTAVARERMLALRFTTTARVYETAHAHAPGGGRGEHHDSHATAILPHAFAGIVAPGQVVEVQGANGAIAQGRLARLDLETLEANGQIEAIINVPDPGHWFDFGAFARVSFDCGERKTLAVPRSALLEAASGTFVYVKNGDRFLRTPVGIGLAGDDWVGITEGLAEGAVVASHGTVDLWLIELRFTKGGGHGH